ncbi:MAG: prephenate dehydrogenase [Actinomycetota bacterium]
MTSTPTERIAVIGTGLMGTSIAMAASRVGCTVTGWDADPRAAAGASERTSVRPASSVEEAVTGAEIVVVCAPIPAIPEIVSEVLAAEPNAVVTDAGSIKEHVVRAVHALAGTAGVERFVGGHPMGGSERSGPEHASASVVDGIVWVLTPDDGADPEAVATLESWIERIGGRPVRMSPERHDRLVAFVSHLPQVASTALMALAATEEADEPEILLLAAGGFRDLTRLASSNPALWSQILLANREAIAEALDLYMERLADLRSMVVEGRGGDVEETFDRAKQARLRLAAKPQVRAGVAVLQIQVPDRPGALAELTAALAEVEVNIEDLQIVHSPEGGRGTVHLTVAAISADNTVAVLGSRAFDPIRLA